MARRSTSGGFDLPSCLTPVPSSASRPPHASRRIACSQQNAIPLQIVDRNGWVCAADDEQPSHRRLAILPVSAAIGVTSTCSQRIMANDRILADDQAGLPSVFVFSGYGRDSEK
jgi:hypothetical protein